MRERIARIAQEVQMNLTVGTMHENGIHIEPTGYKGNHLDGMQIIEDPDTKTFEVSEYMAGPNEDQLWIFGEYKNLKSAVKSMLKGNHTTGRKAIKIWD